MSDEKEIKERILKKGEEMFLQFGFGKVTMDELASELGMSKKTLYKYYPGKEQLLRGIISDMRCTIDDYINEVVSDESLDFVQKIRTIMNYVGHTINKMRGPLLAELQKIHPEIYAEINEARKKGIIEKFSKMVHEGVKLGIFKKDVDKKLLVLVYMSVITGIFTPEIMAELPYTGDQLFEKVAKIIFEGALTDEGRQKFNSTKIVTVKF